MKKVLWSLFLALFCFQVNAKYITAKDLNKYKENVRYLECVYSQSFGCDTNKDIYQARELVQEFKDYDAAGLNISKKRNYDKRAKRVLMMISEEEVKDYMAAFSKMSLEDKVNEYVDDIKFTATIKAPSAMALEGLFTGEEVAPEDKYKTTSFTSNKEKIEDVVKEKIEDDKVYKIRPPYLNRKQGAETLEEEIEYVPNDNFTRMSIISNSKKRLDAANMVSYNKEIMVVARNPKDYSLEVVDMSTVIRMELEELRTGELKVSMEGYDPNNRTINKQLMYKHDKTYKKIEKEEKAFNTITVLELLTFKMYENFKKIKKVKSLKEGEPIFKELQKQVMYGDKYVSQVAGDKSERAQKAVNVYNRALNVYNKIEARYSGQAI